MNRKQKIALWVGVFNLAVLFPPFEYCYAVTSALPTFQGFYFIFFAGPMLTLVTPMFYLEVIFVLFNGAVLWLLFNQEQVLGLVTHGSHGVDARTDRKAA